MATIDKKKLATRTNSLKSSTPNIARQNAVKSATKRATSSNASATKTLTPKTNSLKSSTVNSAKRAVVKSAANGAKASSVGSTKKTLTPRVSPSLKSATPNRPTSSIKAAMKSRKKLY